MADVLQSPATTARTTVDGWLARFEQALGGGDGRTVANLFGTDSYWRDLIAFTWNIKTVEGRAGVADLVTATASRVQASDSRT